MSEATTNVTGTPTDVERRFILAVGDMAAHVHGIAVEKGFWEGDRSDAEAIALMHSELSEALESIRHGHPPDKHCPEFSNTEVEFADLIIRVLDTCHKRGYRLGEAVVAKSRVNAGRPHRHGKKF